MTYQNDPNINRRNHRDDTSYTGWIIGGIVALGARHRSLRDVRPQQYEHRV